MTERKENPGSARTETGAKKIDGKIDSSPNEYSDIASSDQLFVTAIRYKNPVGKSYGLKAGQVDKRGLGIRTSPATGHTLAMTFSEFVTWRKPLTGEFMLTSGTFADVGEVEVAFDGCELGDQVAATKKHLAHRARTGLLIIDIDVKHEAEVAGLYIQGDLPYTAMADALEALSRVLPEADDCALLACWSTSSNIYSPDGDLLKGKGGIRIYIPVADASCIPDLLGIMHKRSWLKGEGWAFVDAAGGFQERSLVDLALARPTQPDFAAPDLQGGLTQDRDWVEHEGGLLDPAAVAPLSAAEEAEYEQAVSVARDALAPALTSQYKIRKAVEVEAQVKRGISPARAKAAAISKLKGGVLLSTDVVVFDDDGEVSVLKLLTDGAAYDGQTCKDPVEPDYDGGRTVGIFYWNDGAGPGIHSVAHGSKFYSLKHDGESLRDVFASGDAGAVAVAFAHTAFSGETDRTLLEKEATKTLGLGNNVKALRGDVDAVSARIQDHREEPVFKGPYPLDRPLPCSVFPFLRDGVLLNHVGNYKALLAGYGLKVGYDVIKKAVVWEGMSIDPDTDNADAVVLSQTTSQAVLSGLPVGHSSLQTHLPAIAEANQINPVKDYLSALTWDGTDRFPLLADAIHPHDPEVAVIALTVWFTGAAACCDHFEIGRGLNLNARPSFEYVLAMLGSQGIGKTKGFLGLVPTTLRSYAKDGLTLNTKDKDSIKTAASYWLAELGELDATFGQSQIAELKAFLSSERDELRLPYSPTYGKYKRRTAFFGSVNQAQFLKDGTGNRRYLALECGAGFPAWSDSEVDQLWAQAWTRYVGGEQWWPTTEQQVMLDKSADQFRSKSWLEEQVESRFQWGLASDGKRHTASDVWVQAGGSARHPTQIELADVGHTLRRLWSPYAETGQDGKLRVHFSGRLVLVNAPGGRSRGWLLPPANDLWNL